MGTQQVQQLQPTESVSLNRLGIWTSWFFTLPPFYHPSDGEG